MKYLNGTIGDCLRLRAEVSPSNVGMSYQMLSYSWKQIDEITDFLAVEYHKLGISHGNHSAIWSVNSPNWVFCFFALVKIGAIPVMINTCYKRQELESLLMRMDVDYLFYGEGIRNVCFPEIVEQLSCESLPKLRQSIPLQKNKDAPWLTRHSFPEEPSLADKELLKQRKANVHEKDTACILPTSGTTSRPKGVMLSHESLIKNSMEVGRQMKWGTKDKVCISVPLFHCFGISTGILASVNTGSSLHILKYYKTTDVLEEIEKHRCTVLNGVPTMFLAIAKSGKRTSSDLSSLKSGIVAGSPMSPKEYQVICNSLFIDKLQVSYGQTESSPCISISDFEDSLQVKAQTAGKIIPDIEVRIWDEENQAVVGSDVQGEIQTRGYHVMQGYYGMPEETAQAIDKEGWLHTGDLGCLNQNGYLQVTGRTKEMIIRGGENISPLEIEICIRQLACVEDVKVLGVKAEVLQEEIVAFIIPKKGDIINIEEIQRCVKEMLADYKVPRYVFSIPSFPFSESGKILTGELTRQAYRLVEEENKCFLQSNMN